MRADRLLSFLMLLQLRGRMTAGELAVELGVSERTIYRDLEALSLAGIPLYAERGPGGGIALVDSYRTTLTGLTRAEARSLLALAIPDPLAALGVGRDLQAAIRKILASLPPATLTEDACAPRVYLDWSGWQKTKPAGTGLSQLYQAVCENRRVRIAYRMVNGIIIERDVDAYGLVAKAGAWYLVCAGSGKISFYRVEELLSLRLLDETFVLPADFSLEAAWKTLAERVDAGQDLYRATVRAAPQLREALPRIFAGQLRADEPLVTDAQGWIHMRLSFQSYQEARQHLLGWGRAVEVLEPEQLRRGMLDYARQVAGLYADESPET